MIVVTHGCVSNVGKVRSENQDSYAIAPITSEALQTPKGILFMVADGMGGHRAGRQASELAVDVVTSVYTSSNAAPIPELLQKSVQEANDRIFLAGSRTGSLRGMGTTCTVLVVQGSSAWTAHIGDSKIYLATTGGITQITTDHSRVWDLYQRGIITREQARNHPERNLLTRALGKQGENTAEVRGPIPLAAGMRFILCSDGLTNHVDDDEIGTIAMARPPQDASEELVAMANERGGTDNVTVLIVAIDEGNEGGITRR